MVSRDGGSPLQVTSDQPCSAGSFSWFPDGSGFVSVSGGKLWHIGAQGGPSQSLAAAPGVATSPRVSPDGTHVAMVIQVDDEQQAVAVVPVVGQQWPRRVSEGDDFVFDPQWSADGRWLAWIQYDNRLMTWDQSTVMLAHVESGRVMAVATGRGVAHAQPRFSPDGTRLAFLSDRGGWLTLWMTTLEHVDGAGEAAPVSPEYVEHAAPAWGAAQNYAWSPDSRRIVHTSNASGSIRLAVVDVPSGTRRLLCDQAGLHADPAWLDASTVVMTFQSPAQPPEVFTLDVDTLETRQLTHSAVGGLGAVPAVFPEPVSWRSADRATCHGLLFTPRPTSEEQILGRGYPVLLQFHGGPTSQSVARWEPMLQYFVQRGWMVLQVNYRGSSGYGKAYQDALNGHWGEGELADAMSAVAWLGAQDRGADVSRIVPWGGSNGGFAVLLCLTKAPDLFKAGVCLYGISDLLTLAEPTSRFERYYQDTLIGPSWDHADYYRTWSPLHHASAVRSPLLLLHGDQDTDVAPDQTGRFVEALARLGKEHEFHVYEGEGHGWRHVNTQRDYLHRMESFLRRMVLDQ